MSSSDIAAHFPIPFQKSLISGNLNSTLLFVFLFGGYLGFYAVTIWMYASTTQSRKKIVITVLTVLFLTTFGQLIVLWYFLNLCFIRETRDRLDTFIITVIGNTVAEISFALLIGIGQIAADALLIWRCYHILAQRKYLKLGLVFLYILEAALIIIGIIMAFLLNFDPGDETDQFTHRYNIVQGTTSCVTVATSILATFIIGAQIYASTTMNRQARKRYKHIIEIIIQSSALYSFSILIGAVTALIGDNATITTSDSVIFNADIYAAAIGGFTTPFAPTLMVARIHLSRSKQTDEFLTNTTYEPQDMPQSAFEETPQQQRTLNEDDVSRESTDEVVHTVNV